MVQPEHLYSSTFRSLPLSAGNTQPVQRAETKSLGSLAAARSKIYRRAHLAWQLHRSVSCAGPIGDFTRFLARVSRAFRPSIEGALCGGGAHYRKSAPAAGG